MTSLPDVSEVPALDDAAWARWFEDAAALVRSSVPERGVAVFFQSDIKRAGTWVGQGRARPARAERVGTRLLFHKIVCRKPAGTVTFGRASYSHLSRLLARRAPEARARDGRRAVRRRFHARHEAMGVNACIDACQLVLRETPTRTVVDPFCGYGTVLAVANALGLAAIGVDLSARMCRKARTLVLPALAV